MGSKVTITYNGNVIVPEYEDTNTAVPVYYNGGNIANIEADNAKVLNCGGKYMISNVVVGDKTLNCAGMVMGGDVSVAVASSDLAG